MDEIKIATQAEMARKRQEQINRTRKSYSDRGYDWNPTTGVITRQVAKIKGKAAVKAHKRERQALRQQGVKLIIAN